MSTNFYLKDKTKDRTSVYAVIRYKGARYKLGLGESVETQYWNPDTKRLRNIRKCENSYDINIRLDKWELIIKKIINSFAIDMYVPTEKEFKQELNNLLGKKTYKQSTFLEYIDIFINKSNKTPRTIKSYNTTKGRIEKFEQAFNCTLQLEDINMQFYNNFKQHIESEGLTKNYFGTMIKNIKLFMDEAKEEKLHDNIEYKNKRFKTLSETSDSVYLSEDELLKIYNIDFMPELVLEYYPDIRKQNMMRKIEAIERVRDLFLIGAYTALRVSDFSRLSEININTGFIKIQPLKGASNRKNEDLIIPIHWVIKEMLQKGFDFSETVSDQKINKHIKTICKIAGIDEEITTSKTIGGKIINKTAPKYSLVTSHTARRSGATNMFKANIPTLRIMLITGHKTEKAFMKYIKISQEENAEILADHPFFKKP